MNVFDALHATAHDPKHGGTDVLAMRLGMKSGGMLRNKTNPNDDKHHMRLDETLRLMELTSDYRVLEAIAPEPELRKCIRALIKQLQPELIGLE